MKGFNNVNLIGRVESSPQVSESGAVCFTLSTEGNYRSESGEWESKIIIHNLVARGVVAKEISRAVNQGDNLVLGGSIVSSELEKTKIEISEFLLLKK